jgi:hypothetical protein
MSCAFSIFLQNAKYKKGENDMCMKTLSVPGKKA